MKIAIVIHDVVKGSGQGRMTKELVKFLTNKGHEVHLFAIKVDSDLKKRKNVIHHYVQAINFTYLLRCITFMIHSALKLRKNHYDIVHFHGAVSLAPYNINTCHFVHSAWIEFPAPLRCADGLKRFYYNTYTRFNAWLERRIYARPESIVAAVSEKVRNELVEKAKVDPRKIKVIYNGVDGEEFNNYDNRFWRRRLREQFHWGSDDFVLLFVGEISERKGINYLFKALEILNDEKIKLLIVGNTPRNFSFEQGWEDKIGKRVKLAGFRKDAPTLYKGADAFIFPTRYDPCPLVLLEAMASGLPVIVSKPSICGTSELITDLTNGVFIENPTDAEEIASKIRLVYENKRLRRKLGKEARKTAENYSWLKMSKEYEGIYCEYSRKFSDI